MKKRYQKAVIEALERTKYIQPEILTEKDILHLPEIVQKYLRYVGAIGKEKVFSFRAEFKGGIRSTSTDAYMPLKSVQYNFIDSPTRLFYIVAKKNGIPAVGIHLYRNETAIFQIKILGFFKVVDAKGAEMNQGETVTVFNDMCFLAPATLISKNISWETLNPLTVNAKFTNGSISISATLFFNEKAELINFISNDRYETSDGKVYKNYPWLTPAATYIDIKGFRLISSAKLIYRRQDEDFCYGEFELQNIEYNCQTLK